MMTEMEIENEGAAPQEPGTEPAPVDENAALKEQLLRALAEVDNIRKRTVREKEEASRYAIGNFARDLLAVADNLARAIDTVPAEELEKNPFLKTAFEGVAITQQELRTCLERHGVRKIDPQGEKFDHNFHQAMFEVETADHEPGQVAQVLQAGYVIHDRLLRPALVGVSKKPG